MSALDSSAQDLLAHSEDRIAIVVESRNVKKKKFSKKFSRVIFSRKKSRKFPQKTI